MTATTTSRPARTVLRSRYRCRPTRQTRTRRVARRPPNPLQLAERRVAAAWRPPTRSRDRVVASSDVNPEAEDRANEVAAESQTNEVKVQFADEPASDDQAQLTPLDEVEAEDDENRNKRYLNFGFGGSTGSSGSGAGSGNFLFDIIRQAADGAARAAGTVYRVVAGTQSLGLGLSASRDLGPAPQDAAPAAAPAGSSSTTGSSTNEPAASGAGNLPPLVAGSGSNSSGVAGKTDEVQEAVPGPVTRLFVIANRGISNLVQDLILRLAATSERIVNFKARLITSII
ncbi:uncharacterized protein LOC143373383 isoform X3 [Andrena cerasifolii]|uniref:uncharacterized protein LOC143373383 isoform X3 n=1 Tax=Andrena cerasifolii TaxID=2819439 RepID=UPI004038124D